MSRRLAVAKDRQGWHVCGPWYYANHVPRGYISVTAHRCTRRSPEHRHIYFSSWGLAMFCAQLIHPGSTLNLRVKVEG